MSKAHVYTVAGSKGGVGKTTTSINLGAALAAAGHETVTVELDLAMANLVDFLDVETSTTFHDVLAGRSEIQEATYRTDSGLSVVPSGTGLDGYADTDLDRLPSVVETLRRQFDVVLLDTPAGLSEETLRPMQLADETILVSTPRVSSIRNTRNTIQLAERVDTDVRGLVLTKSGTGASPGADRIAEFLGVELLGHVPEDDAVPHAQDRGTPVVQDAPESDAAIAYRKVASKIADVDPPPVAQQSSSETGSGDAVAASGPRVATVAAPGRSDEGSVSREMSRASGVDGGASSEPADTHDTGASEEREEVSAEPEEEEEPTEQDVTPEGVDEVSGTEMAVDAAETRRTRSTEQETAADGTATHTDEDAGETAGERDGRAESPSIGARIKSAFGF